MKNIVQQLTEELTAQTVRAQQLERDVEALHKALNDVLPLFVLDHGWDYNCVDAGLAALARNRHRLPITVSLAEKIDERFEPDV